MDQLNSLISVQQFIAVTVYSLIFQWTSVRSCSFSWSRDPRSVPNSLTFWVQGWTCSFGYQNTCPKQGYIHTKRAPPRKISVDSYVHPSNWRYEASHRGKSTWMISIVMSLRPKKKGCLDWAMLDVWIDLSSPNQTWQRKNPLILDEFPIKNSSYRYLYIATFDYQRVWPALSPLAATWFQPWPEGPT